MSDLDLFPKRTARMAELKALINELVPSADARLTLLHAASEYGHAAATEALDASRDLIRATLGAAPRWPDDLSRREAEVAGLDEIGARR